ncbi:SemiSWEET family sugar transporter [Nanoarchaeota archaeon]
MSFLSVLTTIAGVGMTFGYFTQTYKILRRKSSNDVSLATYLIFGTGITIWLIYGISLNNWPIIISNIVAIIGALTVIISYLIYKK